MQYPDYDYDVSPSHSEVICNSYNLFINFLFSFIKQKNSFVEGSQMWGFGAFLFVVSLWIKYLFHSGQLKTEIIINFSQCFDGLWTNPDIMCVALCFSHYGTWLMQLMVLWLILMSMSNDQWFRYNSITVPFTGLCSFYSDPRGARGHPLWIIYMYLKEQYNKKNASAWLCFFNLFFLMENGIIVLLIQYWRVRWSLSSDHCEVYRLVTCRCFCADTC